jgi:hypothetical protein
MTDREEPYNVTMIPLRKSDYKGIRIVRIWMRIDIFEASKVLR